MYWELIGASLYQLSYYYSLCFADQETKAKYLTTCLSHLAYTLQVEWYSNLVFYPKPPPLHFSIWTPGENTWTPDFGGRVRW